MVHPSDNEAAEARAYFPRGLAQPETGFRFSMDALLLAAFAPDRARAVADLGCGCGVIGLAWLLRERSQQEAPSMLGLDRDPEMLRCATANAERLGLSSCFSPLEADVRDPGTLAPESHDLVLINPPYREPGSGRMSRESTKRPARFEEQGGLDDFIRSGARLLRNRSRLCMIHLAGHLPRVLAELASHRLEPKRLRLVHGRKDSQARLFLVEGLKNGSRDLRVEPPLVLYRDGNGRRITDQALAFCPWLACNAGDPAHD